MTTPDEPANPAGATDVLPAADRPERVSRTVDAVLADARDVARAAALDVADGDVGEHLGVRSEGERVATHGFASTLPGYVGWQWAVTVTRAPRSKTVTVDEVVLLPGDGALLAPQWVPWEERIRPGDLSPGDLVPPPPPDDPRLVPAYLDTGDSGDTAGGDAQMREVAFELGLGRERVLSREGRLDAAARWRAGDRGPRTSMARHAPARCGTCGFYLPIEGSLRAAFGVCANEITEFDGQVVSVEYGCGAHSQAVAEPAPLGETGDIVYDDGDEIYSA